MTTDQQAELQALRERVGQLEAARSDVLAADPRLEGLRQWSESIERGNNAWFMLWRGQPKWITVTILAVVGVPLLCGFLVALVLMGIDIVKDGAREAEDRTIHATYAEVERFLDAKPEYRVLGPNTRTGVWEAEVRRRLDSKGITSWGDKRAKLRSEDPLPIDVSEIEVDTSDF